MKLFAVVFVFAVVVGAAACKSGTTCTSWASDAKGASWGQCSDGLDRAVECAPSGPGKYACQCKKDDAISRKFERTEAVLGDKAESTKVANQACGWNLAL